MFTVIEIQENNGEVGLLTYSYEDEKKANQKYHTVLAAAAVSDVQIHSACMINNGYCIKSDAFDHRSDDEDLDVID